MNTKTRGEALLAAHLVDVVQFEVLEEQQEQGRNTLHNDLLVPVHIDAQLHALENSDATIGKGGVNVEGGWRELLHSTYLDRIQCTQESRSLGNLNFCARETSRVPADKPVWRKALLNSVSLSPLASSSLGNVHPHTCAASGWHAYCPPDPQF